MNKRDAIQKHIYKDVLNMLAKHCLDSKIKTQDLKQDTKLGDIMPTDDRYVEMACLSQDVSKKYHVVLPDFTNEQTVQDLCRLIANEIIIAKNTQKETAKESDTKENAVHKNVKDQTVAELASILVHTNFVPFADSNLIKASTEMDQGTPYDYGMVSAKLNEMYKIHLDLSFAKFDTVGDLCDLIIQKRLANFYAKKNAMIAQKANQR